MFNRRIIRWTPVVVFLLASGQRLRAEDPPPAEIGKPAPDFSLSSADGKAVNLEDFKDKIVVLEWTSPACPFVVRHHKRMQTTQKLVEKFEDKGVVWLAIDSSTTATAERATEHAKATKLTYPILIDRDGTVGKRYGAKTTPHVFVIDRKGNLAYAGAMDDDPRGSNPDRRNYVEEAVQSLLDGSTVTQGRTSPYGCSVQYAK